MTRIFLSPPHMAGRERELVAEAFDSNYVAPAGPMLERFESDMTRYTGIAHAVALSSGTAALHLALRLLDVGPGTRVWLPSMTFIGGVSPVLYQGAEPVFFDVDPGSWTMDAALVEQALEAAAADGTLPAAIVPADLYGQCSDLQRIVAAAARYGIPVVCDSAEALGSRRGGRHSGKGARATVLSFNGNKIITTSGGGMLLSDDAELIAEARYLSQQARRPAIHYEHTEIGYNYRLSNVSAAIGVGQLEQIEEKVARRRQIFERYAEAFVDIPDLGFMPEASGTRCNRWLTCMLFGRERASGIVQHVIARCEAADIETRPLWKPMHLQPVFSGTAFVGRDHAADLFARGLCLPSGSGMSGQEQQRVISVVTAAIAEWDRQGAGEAGPGGRSGL
ncbi:MAG: aminotransferase class I/II-fold pyridoxal phosphate-dependent enzyme [Flavobacteriaceae bacterium]